MIINLHHDAADSYIQRNLPQMHKQVFVSYTLYRSAHLYIVWSYHYKGEIEFISRPKYFCTPWKEHLSLKQTHLISYNGLKYGAQYLQELGQVIDLQVLQ